MDLLRLAASLERGSEHPLAGAIVAAAEERALPLSPGQGLPFLTGLGVTGTVEEKTWPSAISPFLESLAISRAICCDEAEELRRDGSTVHLPCLSINSPAGVLAVKDPVKTSTPEALRLLHQEGLRIVMLTGDSRSDSGSRGPPLGIDAFEAEVQPARKGEIVKQLQSEGRIVAMAGDGINDAPALAQARSASPWEPAPMSPWKAPASSW